AWAHRTPATARRYQTLQTCSGCMGVPASQENADQNSGKCELGTFTRNFGGEWGSTAASSSSNAGELTVHQLWAMATKNNCSLLSPSINCGSAPFSATHA